jgi:hypothetical protein
MIRQSSVSPFFGGLVLVYTKPFSLQLRILPISLMLIIGLVTFVVAACGSAESEEALFQQISDPGWVMTIDDLMATSFKEASNNSTDGLPGATDVSYGFLRVGGGEPYDYEVRFYKSHQEAIDLGTAMAVEGTGPDAILSEDDATYKDGIKDRRTIIGGGSGGGARSGIGPKYASYAIFGNVIMLCQGSDEERSLERCALLANALVSGE